MPIRFLLAILLPLTWPPADAGAASQRRAGDFDYYVLALSWSPSYCEAAGKRADPFQCQSERPYAFIVHGLWPQYERGWPSDCPISGRKTLSRSQIGAILDLMPSRGLVRHEWRKHGTCSGLSPARYLALIRQAREKVKIPEPYRRISAYLMVRPEEIKDAFLRSNPDLGAEDLVLTCDSRRLREVRICMTRDLRFRRCTEHRRLCGRDKVVLPPVRIRQ